MFRRDESDRLGAMLLQRSRRPSVDPPADEDPPAEENIVVRGTNADAILAVASRTRCALIEIVCSKRKVFSKKAGKSSDSPALFRFRVGGVTL